MLYDPPMVSFFIKKACIKSADGLGGIGLHQSDTKMKILGLQERKGMFLHGQDLVIIFLKQGVFSKIPLL